MDCRLEAFQHGLIVCAAPQSKADAFSRVTKHLVHIGQIERVMASFAGCSFSR